MLSAVRNLGIFLSKNGIVPILSTRHNQTMFRITVVNFLLLALFACPFNCMGAFRGLLHSKGSVSMGCSCCAEAVGSRCAEAHSEQVIESLTNNSVPDRCTCGQCLCSGAVIGKAVSSSDFGGSQSFSYAPLELNWICIDACCEPWHRQALRPAHGASVRILYQTFLI